MYRTCRSFVRPARFIDTNIEGIYFSRAILNGAQVKVCEKARGTNSKIGVETRYYLGYK